MHTLSAIAAALFLAAAPQAPRPVPVLQREAREAYDRGDRAAFLSAYEQIARRRPGDVTILYNLACGQALNGQTAAAIASLQEIAAHRVAADIEADTDFDSIRASDGFRRVAARMAALRKERIDSGATVAFTIGEKGLVPEGVAYDPVSRSFFVSSIRKRKVFRIDAGGKITELVGPAGGGLMSAAGIGVDPKRRALWVASQAMPHMEGFKKDDPPGNGLFEFDLDAGKLRRQLHAPATARPAAFDDLAVAADGRVYVNDGRSPRIWTLAPGGDEIELFLESDAFRGTQGLVATPDGRVLYVSDYSGLLRVDIAGKAVTRLPVPPDLALNGIDGLAFSSGSLIGIQNGIAPHRVIRLDLSADGMTISRARILEMNNPAFDEPTLGAVAGGALYFVANSQGGRFLDEKRPVKPEEMREALILKLPLGGDAR